MEIIFPEDASTKELQIEMTIKSAWQLSFVFAFFYNSRLITFFICKEWDFNRLNRYQCLLIKFWLLSVLMSAQLTTWPISGGSVVQDFEV